MPYASEQAVSSALASTNKQEPVVALNAAARPGSSAAPAHTEYLPALVVCCDASGAFGGLEQLLAALDMPCYGIVMPQVRTTVGRHLACMLVVLFICCCCSCCLFLTSNHIASSIAC